MNVEMYDERLVYGWWQKYRWFIATISVLVLFDGFMLIHALPVSITDESFYKGVAYELAYNGRYALPLAAGFHPRIEEFFLAGYPPLFMLLLAGWYKILGFGIYQSHAFNMVAHVMTAALSAGLVHKLAARQARLWSVMTAAVVFSYIRMDRPDWLAMALALATLCLALHLRTRVLHRAHLGLAVCWAATLLVQPTATMMYGLLLGTLLLQWWRFDRRFIVTAGVAAASVGVVELTLAVMDPEGFMHWTYPDSVDSPVTPPSLMRRSWPHTPLG